jgi:8-oxo-dGTP diphosphatase
MKRYVVGFRFDGDNVLLIRKAKPEWQMGRLNGVGGKVEGGEESIAAMVREFREETGIDTVEGDWKYVAKMQGCGLSIDEEWIVRVYASWGSNAAAQTTTDEEVIQASSLSLPSSVLRNLHWLVPLCKETEVEFPVTFNYTS